MLDLQSPIPKWLAAELELMRTSLHHLRAGENVANLGGTYPNHGQTAHTQTHIHREEGQNRVLGWTQTMDRSNCFGLRPERL
ncbi:unnamed protein product [Protopolystoma xenopodis]|uniref:Uncharacterized protein n=1 Tax=Protopolystoma xenopodis TaxID=117903 RepID=A0A3S5ANS2_9PLAT|nr:unnamed protein product [Protopolystoma xenopodis]